MRFINHRATLTLAAVFALSVFVLIFVLPHWLDAWT